ncbi:protein MLN51 homolog isoform X2 [Henckelia pumila]|uniref:protein MLN51 homolog isoform X2 n=1 Tax=Henckelia pumila TaxID=405737 RepID=UPI003C6E1D58
MSGGLMAEEDIEYESDPEETKMSLKMRRREASDDDDDYDDDDEEEEEEAGVVDGGEKPVRRVDEFDGESEGAAADYEDDLEEDCYDLDEEYVEEETEEAKYGESGSEMGGGIVPVKADIGEEIVISTNDEIRFDGGGHEEEKKEIEPYSVPTAGAFYMHDDRFQDNTRGRNRRMLAGRKLWESKDNRKWGHDMFEELTTSEKRYGERRRSRGSFRGRGRNRGTSLGYARGYRSDNYSNSSSQNNNNHNNAPKRMRGRGPRRYQPSSNNINEGSPTQNKQKSVEKSSNVASVKTSESASNAEMGVILPRKQGFTSNLSIASPPFYPSGSSTKHNAVEHKKDVQAGTSNRNSPQSAVDESFNGTQSSAMLKGKSIVDSIGVEKLSIDDSLSATARKPSNNMHMLASGSLSTNASQPQMRGHGSGETSSTKWAYQPINSNYQVNRVPPPNQRQTVSRYPGRTPAQSSVQTPDLQLARVSSGGSHTSSPPKVAVLECSKLDYPSEYSKSTTALVATGTGKSNVQGRGSFLYGGAHVMGASGNLGAVHADKKFSAFLPVMQFGGKHPGGMGVPAVGMAFPGYVGQPQPGLGNSEMTWLPVIAGAAGALGAQYCPPFIAVDGSYHAQPSGRVSTITAASSKENKVVSAELADDESGQRQKNLRRYTEMKFDQ